MKFYQEIFHIIHVPSPTIPRHPAHILHPRTASVQTPSQSVETRSRNAHPPCTDIKNLYHSQPLHGQKHINLQPQEKNHAAVQLSVQPTASNAQKTKPTNNKKITVKL